MLQPCTVSNKWPLATHTITIVPDTPSSHLATTGHTHPRTSYQPGHVHRGFVSKPPVTAETGLSEEGEGHVLRQVNQPLQGLPATGRSHCSGLRKVPPTLSLLLNTHLLNTGTQQHRTRLGWQDTPHGWSPPLQSALELPQTLPQSGGTQCKRARAEPLTVPDVVLVMHHLYDRVLEETNWYL